MILYPTDIKEKGRTISSIFINHAWGPEQFVKSTSLTHITAQLCALRAVAAQALLTSGQNLLLHHTAVQQLQLLLSHIHPDGHPGSGGCSPLALHVHFHFIPYGELSPPSLLSEPTRASTSPLLFPAHAGRL